MSKEFLEVEPCKERLPLVDVVKLGSYEEIEGKDLETITKNPNDKGKRLGAGLLLYGYETKFADGTNTNGERYEKSALDKFVQSYFVDRGLNMTLSVQHGWSREDIIGRVVVLEVNSVGFYFVCFIPKGVQGYDDIKLKVENGILQGLSKEGWSTEGEIHRVPKTGDFSYYLVKEMEILRVSLVDAPANGNPLEKAKEIKNSLRFVNKTNAPETADDDEFGAMFNK